MRRRFLSGDKPVYKYSVQYNFVGGQIFADGNLVGVVQDVNVPVEFESENPEVFVTITGVPENKKEIVSTTKTQEFKKADSISGNFYFQMQDVTAADIHTVTFLGRFVNNLGHQTLTGEAYIYNENRYKNTTYSSPQGKTINPGEIVSFKYTSNISYSNGREFAGSTETSHTLSLSDNAIMNIKVPIHAGMAAYGYETKNFTLFRSDAIEDLEWNESYSVSFSKDVEEIYIPLDKPNVGTANIFNFDVPVILLYS